MNLIFYVEGTKTRSGGVERAASKYRCDGVGVAFDDNNMSPELERYLRAALESKKTIVFEAVEADDSTYDTYFSTDWQ